MRMPTFCKTFMKSFCAGFQRALAQASFGRERVGRQPSQTGGYTCTRGNKKTHRSVRVENPHKKMGIFFAFFPQRKYPFITSSSLLPNHRPLPMRHQSCLHRYRRLAPYPAFRRLCRLQPQLCS